MDGRIESPRPATRARARAEVMPGIDRPKALFLLAAGLSFLMSVSLYFTGSQEQGIFVGIWVPSILALGCYYRLATGATRNV